MPKRFSATELWDEDWFLDMPNEYKLFWYYMLSVCDHAGFFRVNLGSFNRLLGVSVAPIQAIEYFNAEKDRIRIINKGLWLIEDFFVFQYGNILNLNSPLHRGVEKQFIKNNTELTSIRGLKALIDRVKDKEEEDSISNVLTDTEKNGRKKSKRSGYSPTPGQDLYAGLTEKGNSGLNGSGKKDH